MGVTSLNISDGTVKKSKSSRLKIILVVGVVILILIAAGIAIAVTKGYFVEKKEEGTLVPPNPTQTLPPSASHLRVFKKAAVCADGVPCAEIGMRILERGGSAVDATIATMLCNGVYTMQSMGLGGGFIMTIYNKAEKRAYTLNAREKAPAKAKPELYKDDKKLSLSGPLSIAVPGELKGYWEAYQRFGKLPWKDLVQPTVELCEKGYNMSAHQRLSLQRNVTHPNDTNFNEWFKNPDGSYKREGSKIIPTRLCETLKVIADEGGNTLYNGSLAVKFAEDLAEIKSLVSADDLKHYTAEWMDPVTVKFRDGDQLFTVKPPGSGLLLGFIMNILDGYNFEPSDIEDLDNRILTYHRIIEAFKYAYAKRTELGDTNFVNITQLINNLTSTEYADHIRRQIIDNGTSTDPKHYGAVFYTDKENHGTAHISVLAENGDAVSATSSVNIYFGAGVTGRQTGIIPNSVMDDFSFPYFKNYFGLPGSPNNELVPGKRPLSSMSPAIVVDKDGEVQLVIGGSGGTKITTSVALVILRLLQFGQNIKEAVDAPRFHHQLYPMQVAYEYGTLQQEVDGLEKLEHKTMRYDGKSGSIICALYKTAKKIFANADYRKGGDVYGIN